MIFHKMVIFFKYREILSYLPIFLVFFSNLSFFLGHIPINVDKWLACLQIENSMFLSNIARDASTIHHSFADMARHVSTKRIVGGEDKDALRTINCTPVSAGG